MINAIIIIAAYLLGAFIAYWMLKTEHEAEKETHTKGSIFFAVLFSVFTWLTVLILMARAWFMHIGKKGYWDKPAKKEAEVTKVEVINQ